MGPGRAAFPHHYCLAKEEAICGLGGPGTLRPSREVEEVELSQGDYAALPTRAGGAHQFVNTSGSVLGCSCLRGEARVGACVRTLRAMARHPRTTGILPSGEERARLVREMFDRIAGRYELLNAVMTAGLYRLWNREAVGAAGLGPGDRALDLACGTGSLTRLLAGRVGPAGSVLGVDFSPEMLRAAEARPVANVEYRLGDATDLAGVPSGRFDAATIAYGARNIPDLDALFSEMSRALRPGGRAVCLEIARPRGRLSGAFYGLWFDGIVPKVGGAVSGDPAAYSYLPESVKAFVAPAELAVIMERNGLQDVTWDRLGGGIITLHRGTAGGVCSPLSSGRWPALFHRA